MYSVTMLEADGQPMCKGNFKGFKQECHTMYLHRDDKLIGRIFATDESVEVHSDKGIMTFERKEFELLYLKNADMFS